MGSRVNKIFLYIILVIILVFNFLGIPLLMSDVDQEDFIAVRESVRAWEPYSDWPRAW